MNIRTVVLAPSLLAAALAAAGAIAADSNAGKRTFRAQCALCHTAEAGDNGGAQGPALIGVFGRAAGGDPRFSYTQPMRSSPLVWNAATLDRFLAAPTAVVPGSSMVIAVPGAEDRQNIIAYLDELKRGTFVSTTGPSPAPPPATAAATAPRGEADWKRDAPGRGHRIEVGKLPAPFATGSVRNNPKVIDKPVGGRLAVPAGFKVEVFASGLQAPRTMRRAPNGDIFVAESQPGRIKVMRPSADGATAASVATFAQGLMQPFGLEFYPSGANPRWLYVAETNRVVRYPYKPGDSRASGVPQVVVAQLHPVPGGGHWSRDIAFSPDGRRMFVSVGSAGNFAEDMPKKSVAEAQAWEARHGLGAPWGREVNRAAVLVFELTERKPGTAKIFATGIRNCVGLTVQPVNGELWCTTNERDLLGDDLVPDYSTRVKQGGFYGWPWYYIGNHEEPRLKGERPDLAGKVTVPDVLFQAHSAALNLTFYSQTSGASAFPQEYVGDGFAALHGSWNRAFRTGHKVVRLRMTNGVPNGDYEDFLTGFIADDGNAWGRPVGLVVAADGSLLVSEDGNNTVYRISTAQP
jgi:glucose/arabinose dehydrogenase/cytochrome c2